MPKEMDALKVISCRRKGTKLYVWNQKTYVLKNEQEGRHYFECQKKRSGCSTLLWVDNKAKEVMVLQAHEDCSINQNTMEAKQEMKQLAEEGSSGQSLRAIFNAVSDKHRVPPR